MLSSPRRDLGTKDLGEWLKKGLSLEKLVKGRERGVFLVREYREVRLYINVSYRGSRSLEQKDPSMKTSLVPQVLRLILQTL